MHNLYNILSPMHNLYKQYPFRLSVKDLRHVFFGKTKKKKIFKLVFIYRKDESFREFFGIPDAWKLANNPFGR